MISYICMFFCGFGCAFALMMILWVAVYFDEEHTADIFDDDDYKGDHEDE